MLHKNSFILLLTKLFSIYFLEFMAMKLPLLLETFVTKIEILTHTAMVSYIDDWTILTIIALVIQKYIILIQSLRISCLKFCPTDSFLLNIMMMFLNIGGSDVIKKKTFKVDEFIITHNTIQINSDL